MEVFKDPNGHLEIKIVLFASLAFRINLIVSLRLGVGKV